MKLCVDCKFSIRSHLYHNHLCNHPSIMSPVTGNSYEYCSIMRGNAARCKEEGLLWEPKVLQSPQFPPNTLVNDTGGSVITSLKSWFQKHFKF